MASLADYLDTYGKQLGEQASRALSPLHTPGVDPIIEPALLREPYEAQSHVITACVRALDRQRGIHISGECGVGKTFLSQAIAQGHSRGGYRALVLCPPHLTGKWEREIRATVKNAHVHHIESYKDLLNVVRDAPPFGRGWWIVSNTKAKMGPKWRPAFAQHRQKGKIGVAYCPKCDAAQTRTVKEKQEIIPLADFFKKKHYCCWDSCQEPLWQWTSDLDRWPVATYIHKRLKGWFQYFIADEAHQSKSADTAIGQAVGSLSAACDYTIAMSGTMVGGYAWHVRPLLFRIAPSSLIHDGITWQDETSFNEKYGRIEKRIVESESTRCQSDNKQSKGRSTKTTKYVRPGVMPGLFGKHLIQNTVFLSLEDMVENLPMLTEKVIPITMDAELEEAYRMVESALKSTLKEMLRKKDKRLLSTMLNALLGYPDHPYGWKDLGYYDYTEGGANVWHSVVTPPTLDKRIRPKEQHVIDTCLAEKALGRQTWVYSTMTDARDVNERLRGLLAGVGLKTEVLRSSVDTGDREDWIAKHAPGVDVCISHPQLVETGLDLFAKDRSYNFSTLYFYSTGTSTFTQRQAARRSYRLGQNLPCKVFYAAYAGTMQERLLELMAEKQSASELIDGKFSTEGLLALCGDDGDTSMALAKSLVEKISNDRGWQKVRR